MPYDVITLLEVAVTSPDIHSSPSSFQSSTKPATQNLNLHTPQTYTHHALGLNEMLNPFI